MSASALRSRWRALDARLKRFLTIVVGAFVLYNANFRELGLADTVPATLLPARIVRHGDLTLDEFQELLRTSSYDGMTSLERQVEWTMAIREIDGHLRSSYPIGAALLATPVYALPAAFGWLHDFSDYRLAAKLAASLMVAFSAGFLFLALARICSLDAAVFLSAVYAFGTSAWTIASQALWQHGPAMLCLSAAAFLALRLAERPSNRDALLLSLALGLAFLCRPQNLPAIGALALFALWKRPRSFFPLLGPLVMLAGWQLAYNARIFHDLRGGYPALFHSQAHGWRGLTPETGFTLPLHEGLSGLLVSPGKGLLVYSPAMALPLVALPVLALRQPRSVAPFLLAWVVVTLLALAKNRIWWAGTCYGPRYLLEATVALTLGAGIVWPSLPRGVKVAFCAAAAFGVFAQVVGMLTWECGWHHVPKWLDFAPERLWDWDDPEIARCTEVLFSAGPKPADLGPFAH